MRVMRQGRLRKVAVAILLPMLFFRGLIPVGFMLFPGTNSGFQIDLCPGTMDGTSFIAARADPHAQHGHHDAHRSPPCPYALSGAALLTSVLFAPALPAAIAEQPLLSVTTPLFLPAIARVQMPRAPPA